MLELSLVMVKPHAFDTKKLGIIVSMLEQNGFRIVGLKSIKLTTELARRFYFVHEDKEFFERLIKYMSSGTIAAICVQKENCVVDLRKLIGATDPTKAEVGTIRRTVGETVSENGVHASDCIENARKEIRFFFSDIELYSYQYLEY
ncbi:MAG: nucleoside-diphosphate kinase [Candidatus Delongbacteria bacterium]|nr:nucleoside-diphosphate kinase [Candidatus Delongbacteria bacterium]